MARFSGRAQRVAISHDNAHDTSAYVVRKAKQTSASPPPRRHSVAMCASPKLAPLPPKHTWHTRRAWSTWRTWHTCHSSRTPPTPPTHHRYLKRIRTCVSHKTTRGSFVYLETTTSPWHAHDPLSRQRLQLRVASPFPIPMIIAVWVLKTFALLRAHIRARLLTYVLLTCAPLSPCQAISQHNVAPYGTLLPAYADEYVSAVSR